MRTHRILPWLKAGATAFLTSFQCSSVGPVNKLVPPKNCTCICQLTASIEVLLIRLGLRADQHLLHQNAFYRGQEQEHTCAVIRDCIAAALAQRIEHLCKAVTCALSAKLRW